jgi:hypothetical protein
MLEHWELPGWVIAIVACAEGPLLRATVTMAVPAVAIRLAGTEAAIWVGPKKVVGSGEPFHCNTAPGANPLPLAVNVKACPPADTLGGFSELIASAVTRRRALFEVDPPEITVTVAVPVTVIRLAGTEAVTCVALT